MQRITRYRPSAAMVVAVIALVFGATRVAVGQSPVPVRTIQTASGTGTVEVECPGEANATGGGAQAEGGLKYSFPFGGPGLLAPLVPGVTPVGWVARASDGGQVTAYVICETP